MELINDTIVAPATSLAPAAVAIVRLSGPDAFTILHKLWRPLYARKLRYRQLYLGEIREPSGALLDRALAVMMPAPKSFTGEDVAELHCHGGTFIVRRVIAAALAAGARMANPGEFTRRAFLNGRIDLTEAEAIADLVNASSENALAQALAQLNGLLSNKVRTLRKQLIDIRVQLEAQIDFSDEDIDFASDAEVIQRIDLLLADIEALHDSFNRGKLVRSGVRVAIVGKPNVGKSSLMNLLLGTQRAIVTPIPGTTRDLIEDTIQIGGFQVVLQDGAGIRDTEETVERIGIELARRNAGTADVILAVFDASAPLEQADREVVSLCAGRPAIGVLNKADLPRLLTPDSLRALGFTDAVVELSAVRGDGLEQLRTTLAEGLARLHGEVSGEKIAISRERHRVALARALDRLKSAKRALQKRMPPEIVTVDITGAAEALASITGEVTSEDVLDAIFSEFCIGK